MGLYANTQLINRRFRILPLPASSQYELWDNVERRKVSRKPYHDYYSALMARIALERGYDRAS